MANLKLTRPKSITRIFIFLITLFFLTGCQLPYMLQSAWTHLRIMSTKKELSKALQDPNLPEPWRKKIELTLESRSYIKDLGLKLTKNYSTFVDVKKNYISHLLIVTEPYSLKPKTWWFPLIGSFPYKGFHNLKSALDSEKKYKEKSFDSFVRGVTAYSTLGWFNDPLLSTMLNTTDANLIEILIHESVHSTVFIKNNVDFNEQLAVFIAQKATLNYFKNKSETEFKNYKNEIKDELIYADFLNFSYEYLNSIYSKPENQNQSKKVEAIKYLKTQFVENYSKKISSKKYEELILLKLNNAFIAAQRTYLNNQSNFEKYYNDKCNSDIKKFISKIKSMSSKKLIKTFEPSKL